ncbi:hypothetical protein Naga_100011g20 [Nannochloropsis gaditana]|uniref:Uncharacterized protein n=1 Tax=Nannochloropsis gaditana TaxID=72520 RepID=W7T7T6_9STRA|nr:hypothetical protein Naga_100011g20 [Nannochloropsis gaditana]
MVTCSSAIVSARTIIVPKVMQHTLSGRASEELRGDHILMLGFHAVSQEMLCWMKIECNSSIAPFVLPI